MSYRGFTNPGLRQLSSILIPHLSISILSQILSTFPGTHILPQAIGYLSPWVPLISKHIKHSHQTTFIALFLARISLMLSLLKLLHESLYGSYIELFHQNPFFHDRPIHCADGTEMFAYSSFVHSNLAYSWFLPEISSLLTTIFIVKKILLKFVSVPRQHFQYHQFT